MKKLIAFLLCTILLTGCAAQTPAASPEPTASPDADRPSGVMSDFTTQDLDGNAVTAQDAFSGYRMTMVNVWATYCGPCIREMPDLGELAGEFADRSVRIVGLVSDATGYGGVIDEDAMQAARDIVQETGADYLHLIPSPSLDHLLTQITAVPTTFFVDENGCQVGKVYAGSRDKEDWAAILEETLALLED
ncbi:MAG: redoxin family protein [Candidatus Spyradocola sp.]